MGVGKGGRGRPPPSLESGEADTLFCPPTLDIYFDFKSAPPPHFKIASYANDPLDRPLD